MINCSFMFQSASEPFLRTVTKAISLSYENTIGPFMLIFRLVYLRGGTT